MKTKSHARKAVFYSNSGKFSYQSIIKSNDTVAPLARLDKFRFQMIKERSQHFVNVDDETFKKQCEPEDSYLPNGR